MRVAVIGSGGREHALAWKIARSEHVSTVLCLPGNGGTGLDPRLVNVPVTPTDLAATEAAVLAQHADLVVIGPEAPLVGGLADRLRARGLLVVGPNADGARLEGSKAFAKSVLERAGVRTARAVVCRSLDEVAQALPSFDQPPVVKADGLAAGKGVILGDSNDDVLAAARLALEERAFGSAGEVVLLEERLYGVEASFIVLTDGTDFAALPTTQDHKRLLDGDRGPNTGGMGAYLPNPFVDAELDAELRERVIAPVLALLRADGIDYRGFLYAGVMLTPEGPAVLEFNVRSGDPETQPIMLGLEQDLVPVLVQVAEGRLAPTRFTAQPTAAVVLAARGYPGRTETGEPIAGLDDLSDLDDLAVFHAGTRLTSEGLVTSGGRVLAVAARADTLARAVERAYDAAARVDFEGLQYRRDIGRQGLGLGPWTAGRSA
jgi:phosphoribosylamine---glycine ligase